MKEHIIFFGTGEFGAAMLDALFKSGYQIDLVITQPDRPVGRKQIMTPPAVKKLADSLSLKVEQPETLRGYEITATIPDLIVVCQYGLIIPKRILEHSKRSAINVHTSLLPKYRGASPIQSALVNGEKETGITIMLMDEKMDHGPILRQRTIEIDPLEKYQDLRKKMCTPAAELLIETLNDWLAGKIEPIVQNESEATLCKVFSRDDGKINWNLSAFQIFNLYRGLDPWPGVWTTWNEKRIKLIEIEPANETFEEGIINISCGEIYIGCKVGSIKVKTLQIEGKKPLSAKDFISGHAYINGNKLG